MCEADNVTFANDMEVSRIYIGSASTGDNCKLRIYISRCEDSGNGGKVLEVLATEINIMATFNSVEMFYGYNVRVMIDNDCDFCGSQVLYLPDMKPTGQLHTFIKQCNNHGCIFCRVQSCSK
jgi:hypothetical protein